MKWLKEENGRLVSPPIYDIVTGLANCHLNETWLINNGCRLWSQQEIDQWNSINNPDINIDTTNFDNACNYFRQVCLKIGELINEPNFKGSYQEIMQFYNSDAYKTDKGIQLAIAWQSVNDLCKHEGLLIGLDSPQWWNKCWQQNNNYQNNLYSNIEII